MANIYNIEFNDTHENIIRKINNNFKALSINLTKKTKQRIRINTDSLVNDINEALDLIENEIEDETNSRVATDADLSEAINNLADKKATTTTLGMVIVGSGLAIDAAGVISLDVQNLDNVGF